MGVNHGVGFNRVEGGFSGPLAGRLTFAINGSLTGQRAVEEGFGSQTTPIFLQAGIDTTKLRPAVRDTSPARVRPRPVNRDSLS